MHRNVTAAVVQLLGIAMIVGGGFWVSVPAGIAALGFAVVYLGLAIEGDR